MRSLKIFSLFAFMLLFQVKIAEAAPVGPRHYDKDIVQGIERLYNCEFIEAEQIFSRIAAERPSEPGAYFYLAMVTWSRLASGFWSREIVEEYDGRIDKAVAVARKEVEKETADAYDYFYLGGALGFKGRIRLMERKWFSSFFLAMDAVHALKNCQRMDPGNKDVLFGLGIFDYYTARLSGAQKFLTSLLIRKGDRAAGLRMLHVAAEEAPYSSIEAKSILAHIYVYLEKGKLPSALALSAELARRFEKNPRYIFLEGICRIRLGQRAEFGAVVQRMRDRGARAPSEAKARVWNNQALYLKTCDYLFHRQYDMAWTGLEEILARNNPESDPIMSAFPLLKQGMIYDIKGERERALERYRRILKMKNGAGAQFFAQKYIERPAKKGTPFLGY